MTNDNYGPNLFERIVKVTSKTIKKRIENEIGFSDDPKILYLLKNEQINIHFKETLCEFAVNQRDSSACFKELKSILLSRSLYERDIDWGLKDLVHNVYHHYDAAYNKFLAIELKMSFFVFQGGLIEDSRDFCAAHNNKVWSIEEAKKWVSWTPSKGQYPPNYIVKSTSPDEVPSYLNYPGYDPFIDIGGYNCRHGLGWITDGYACRLRPELKEIAFSSNFFEDE